jgi:hypothetical protein
VCVCVCVCVAILSAHTHCIRKSTVFPLHTMEALGGERKYSFYSLLTPEVDGGEYSASRPGRA